MVDRLARVGYDNPIGYLEGGFRAWLAAGEEVETVQEVTVEDLIDLYKNNINILDVRRESEFDSQHVQGAVNFPLDFINKNMQLLDKDKQYFLHCMGGYRSMIAISILKARGFHKLVNVEGGFKVLMDSNIPKTDFVEQATEL